MWIACTMYFRMEEKKKKPGLPPRWPHARFLDELVYNLIFPGQSKTKASIESATRQYMHHQFTHFPCLDNNKIVLRRETMA